MIEVEIKCLLTTEQEQRLIQDAINISHEIQTDVYYDTSDYTLSLKDFWLRRRNGTFQLKMPIYDTQHQNIISRQEIADEQIIKQHLTLPTNTSLQQALADAGIKPLYTLRKDRTKYTKDGFIIDVDKIAFPDFILNRCEIEVMVENKQQIAAAQKRIHDFALGHGLTDIINEASLDRDTLAGYIRYLNPEHYELLKKAWEQRLAHKK
jgi:predicted adenylyl cyclase CyaB